MKQKICFMALLCFFCSAKAQTSNKGLSIGSKVPDVLITNVINDKQTQYKLSDFKGKLVILDFWATWCSPCISMFPKTDSLQHAFRDNVQFLPVTYESKEQVDKLFSRKSQLKKLKPSMVVGDKVLHDLFPHQALPHYVWIDGDGVVIAITGYQEINTGNIQGILDKKKVSLSEKRENFMTYDRTQLLFTNDSTLTDADVHYEVIMTPYNPHFTGRLDIVRNTNNEIVRITAMNTSLRNLYAIANTINDHRVEYQHVLFEVKDEAALNPDFDRLSKEEQQKWREENTICYELKVPSTLSSQIFSLMKQDLDRLLPHYKATMEKRITECLVLERTSAADKIKTSGQKPYAKFDHTEGQMINCALALLVNQLGGVYLQHLPTPVIDATGYTGKVDITLIGDLSNVESIRASLKKYDLDLVRKTMPIDRLIIRDTK